MKSLYKYMVLAVALLFVGRAMAQEVVNDQLVYDRVTGYMTNNNSGEELPVKRSRNIQDIRYKHDIRVWYGAPGLVSEIMLDNFMWGRSDIGPIVYPESIRQLRHSTSPMLQLSVVGAEYSQQVLPWLAIGGKATFSAVWQYEYHTISKERLYDYNRYNVALLLDARFSWLRRDIVEMYSSVGIGLSALIQQGGGGLFPMADAALVGLQIGRSFYGFVEVGAGIGGSVRGGLGIRFNSKK